MLNKITLTILLTLTGFSVVCSIEPAIGANTPSIIQTVQPRIVTPFDETKAANLGQAGLDASGKLFASQAQFLAQITSSDGVKASGAFSSTQGVGISARIKVAPADQGQLAEILIVAMYNKLMFMKTTQGWTLWDGSIQSLMAAQDARNFAAIEDLEIIDSLNLVGDFQIFIGYRRPTALHFSPNPLSLSIIQPNSSSSGYDLRVDPNPLAANITLDTAKAVSKKLFLEGGTLETKGSDGVTYTLTIPSDALQFPTTITMTPLANLTGVPLGEKSYGVQLSPDGLEFLNFASLKITPAAGMNWPVTQQIPAAMNGPNNLVSLALIDTKSTNPELKLLHFSSYAVLLSEKGFNASVSGLRTRIGGSEERRLTSAMAELRVQDRMGNQSQAEVTASAVAALVQEYKEKVLNPRIAAAKTSCAAAKLAHSTFVEFLRLAQLNGDAMDNKIDQASLSELRGIGSETCMREEYEICRDEHIITRIIPLHLGLYRQESILNGWDGNENTQPKTLQVADEYARKCLQFEIQLDSDSSFSLNRPASPVHTVTESVSGRLKVGFQMNGLIIPPESPADIRGTGALIGANGFYPLTSSGYKASYTERCYEVDSQQGYDSLFGAGFLAFEPDVNSPSNPGGANRVKDFMVSIAAGLSFNFSEHQVSEYQLEDIGCGAKISTLPVLEGWIPGFYSKWTDTIASPDGGALVSKWNIIGNQDIMATKDVTINDTNSAHETIRGSAHLILFHKPI